MRAPRRSTTFHFSGLNDDSDDDLKDSDDEDEWQDGKEPKDKDGPGDVAGGIGIANKVKRHSVKVREGIAAPSLPMKKYASLEDEVWDPYASDNDSDDDEDGNRSPRSPHGRSSGGGSGGHGVLGANQTTLINGGGGYSQDKLDAQEKTRIKKKEEIK